ncbi:MAG: 50S ribosomal protein L31 [Succinivibrionaceae bacterium]|nr:50S ribosomal protein L31 [Succinivibrionaceae bacterium]
MKKDIHPAYGEITVKCSCGNVFTTRSTLGHDIQIDVCSVCHPFYTGKQKIVDNGGRVERFNKRFAMLGSKK